MSISPLVVLPRLHRTTGYELRPVFATDRNRSALGYPVSQTNCLGDHWALEIEPAAMATLCGRAFLGNILRGRSRPIRVPIPQRGVDIGTPGGTTPLPHSDGAIFGDGAGYAPVTPRVDGDGQAGSTLRLIGATPGYVVRGGLFFTLVTAMGSSAHLVQADATVDDAGRVEVSFWPMLWLEPRDADHIEMFKPFIQGVVVDQGGQAAGMFRSVRSDVFTIEEAT